jgi:hypothetical protein
MSSVRLYVGFGGSGLKTLRALVRKLGAQAEWADQLDTHFAFFLIDTNRHDLEKYHDEIMNDCRRLGREPVVVTMQTSAGVADFQRFVSSKFQAAGHHDRLKNSWFYSAEGAPFNAERFTGSPEEGAGQCPLISTFLAWQQLPTLSVQISDAVEQLQRRLTLARGEQGWTVFPTYVAGLAGGTGRGCWSLLAFKIREELARIGLPSKPVGVFYDASVFGDVMAEDPGRANKMRINSLTGISELTGWMKNEYVQPAPFNFTLPSLDRPSDRASDVIDVGRVVKGPDGKTLPGVSGQSPVSQALVLFGKGKAGAPSRPEMYYDIAANALYNRLICEIAGSVVNGESFGSVGATSISIPIGDIRDYVSHYVQKFLPEFFAQGIDASKADAWVKHLTAPIESPVPFTYSAKSDGALVERILAGVLANQEGRFRRLASLLDKKQYKEAQAECARIDSWAESGDGRAAIKEIAKRQLVEVYWGAQSAPDIGGTGGLLRDLCALDSLSAQDFTSIYGGHDASGAPRSVRNPVAAALGLLLMRSRLQLQTADGKTDSVELSGFEAKRVFAVRLAAQLEQIAATLPNAPRGGEGSPGSEASTDAFTKARKGFLGSSVTADEAKQICSVARKRVQFRCMETVREELERALNQAAHEIKTLGNSLHAVVEELQQRAESKRKDIAPRREQLFWTDNDFDSVLAETADRRYKVEMLADQVLQPVADDAALQRALLTAMQDASNDRVERASLRFAEGLKHWIVETSASAELGESKRRLRRMLDNGIRELSNDLGLSSKFYRDHFGFFETVRGLVAEWGKRLRARRGIESELTRLQAAFRTQFGMDFPMDESGPQVFEGNDLDQFALEACKSMAVSLGVRCDVLFDGRSGPGQIQASDVVKVVLPAENWFSGDEFVAGVRSRARQTAFVDRGSFDPIPTFKPSARGNAFAMLAYAQKNFPNWKSEEGLDQVASLDYHRDPGLTRWLEACEDPEGWSLFESDSAKLPMAEDSFGLGFTSPAFVRDEVLKQQRWRPWARHAQGQQEARRAFAFDAVAYALLDEPLEDPLKDALLAVHEEEGWILPVLALRDASGGGGAQAKKWQFCRSAYRDDMGKRLPSNPAFRADQGFSSIRKLLDFFGTGDGPAAEALAGEAEMYFGQVLWAHREAVAPDGAVKAMFRELRTRLDTARDAETGHTQEEYRRLYDALIARVTALGSMSCRELADHFKRRGKH